MTVKKFYKHLQKALPDAAIFVTVKWLDRLLAENSTALSQYGEMEVIDLRSEYDEEINETIYYIKAKG